MAPVCRKCFVTHDAKGSNVYLCEDHRWNRPTSLVRLVEPARLTMDLPALTRSEYEAFAAAQKAAGETVDPYLGDGS